MVDEPNALPMFVAENRTFINQNTHDFLVLHKTASGGSAQNIATFFANDPAMASTHYVIGQDGTVVQCVLEKDGAGGNCCLENGHASFLPLGVNLNVKSVSIEHVDPASDNSTPLTNAQKAASFRLVQHICERHNIPKRRATNDGLGGIIGHNDIAPINKARCPGNYPWNELFSYLQGGQGGDTIAINIQQVSGYFDELDITHWRCKQTGRVIQFAILDFYKAFGGNALCGLTHLGLPVSPEIPLDAKGNVRQHFERGVLFYDVQHTYDNPPGAGSVYAAHLYTGAGQDPDIAIEQAKVAALQAELAAVPQTTGIDAAKVKQFQTGLAAQAAALEAAIIVPIQ
jgi:N-acetyl-anhydromuramyl-L-alanine amidase AmpD